MLNYRAFHLSLLIIAITLLTVSDMRVNAQVVVPVYPNNNSSAEQSIQMKTFGYATITPTPNPTSQAPVGNDTGTQPGQNNQPITCKGAICAFKFIVSYQSLCCRWMQGRTHYGVDLVTKANTPIRALEDGVVVQASYDRGGGNYYKIHDKNKRFHMGLHMIRPASVKVGQIVKRGDVLGYVGHTGANTSPTDHLHYQISTPGNNQYGAWTNPEVILKNWPNY